MSATASSAVFWRMSSEFLPTPQQPTPAAIEHIISEETFDHIKSFLNEQDTDGGQR